LEKKGNILIVISRLHVNGVLRDGKSNRLKGLTEKHTHTQTNNNNNNKKRVKQIFLISDFCRLIGGKKPRQKKFSIFLCCFFFSKTIFTPGRFIEFLSIENAPRSTAHPSPGDI
jgi:hypothetical protein